MEEVDSGERWGETRPQCLTKWKEGTKGLRPWRDIQEGATGNAVLKMPFLKDRNKVYVLTLRQELQRGEVGGTWGTEGLAAPVKLRGVGGGCDSEA